MLIWPTFGQARAGGVGSAYRRARPAGWRGRLVYREESNNFRIESDVFIKMNPFYSQISHIEIQYFNQIPFYKRLEQITWPKIVNG